MTFDRSAYRDKFLGGFKPKEQDISTPYLLLPDGTNFDGKLKVRGISGKESLEIRRSCTINGALDNNKLIGKLAVKCLYLRAVDGLTNEQISDGNTTFLEPTDENEFLDLDFEPFNELGKQVLMATGMADTSRADAKKNSVTSETTDAPASS